MRKRIKVHARVTTSLGSGDMVSERWGIDHVYEGLQVKSNQHFLAKTTFIQRGEATTSTGIVKRLVGDTQDVVNDQLQTEVRSVNTISGRDKQVANKKAQGELRRKRHEGQALSFGVSQPKSYHKQKHSQSKI